MNNSNFDNFDLKYLDKLLNEEKANEFEKKILPIVVTGHGVLHRNRFVKVPENYIIITFQRDGYILGIDYGRSKSSIERKCKNPNIQFLYFWIQYLQYCSHISSESGNDFLQVMKENIHILEGKIKKYRDEIEPLFKNSSSNTYVFYPNDLIAESKFSIANDKSQKIRLGITDWKTMLSEGSDTCFSGYENQEYSLNENHLFQGFERGIAKKKTAHSKDIILLSELLNFMVEKTGLSTKTRKGSAQNKIYKVLFLISCRGFVRDITETFTLKPWIPANPFKNYLNELQKLSKYKPQIDSKIKTIRDAIENVSTISKNIQIRLFDSSVFLYNYFYIASMMLVFNFDTVGVSFTDVSNLQKMFPQNRMNKNNLLNVMIPFRDTHGELIKMNKTINPNQVNALIQNSYFVPPNVVGYIAMKGCFSGSMKSLVNTNYFDQMWNEKARKYIFEKWALQIEPYLEGMTRSKKYEYITNMRKYFVYKKEFRNIDKYKMLNSLMFYRGTGELVLNVPEVFDYSLEELELVVINYKLHNRLRNSDKKIIYLKFPFIDKKHYPLWTAVYNYSLLLKDFPYETPFEYAFANYRWVDMTGKSIINELMDEPNSNDIYIEGICDLYRNGSKYYEYNFHGHIGKYREVIYNIIVPLQNIFIKHISDPLTTLEKLLKLYSYKVLVGLGSPFSESANFSLPKHFLRYIETYDAIDVIYGKFLIDQLNFMISKDMSIPSASASTSASTSAPAPVVLYQQQQSSSSHNPSMTHTEISTS